MAVGQGLLNAVNTTRVVYNHCQKYACYMPVNPLAPDFFFFNFSTPVYKM